MIALAHSPADATAHAHLNLRPNQFGLKQPQPQFNPHHSLCFSTPQQPSTKGLTIKKVVSAIHKVGGAAGRVANVAGKVAMVAALI